MRFGFFFLVLLLLLVLLAPLHDAALLDPQPRYERIKSLLLRGQLTESQQAAEAALERFVDHGPPWASRFLTLKAEILMRRGMYDEALRSLSASSISTTDPDEIAMRLAVESVALLRKRQVAAAADRLRQADAICVTDRYPACGDVKRAEGILASNRGDFPASRSRFSETLQFARARHDNYLAASAMLNLGWVGLQTEHFDEAVDWLELALRECHQLGAQDLEEKALGNLGWAYFNMGDRERARSLFAEAERNASRLGNLREQLKWRVTAGNIDEEEGKTREAERNYQEALTLARTIDSREDLVVALERLAHLAAQGKSPDQASRYLDELASLPSTATSGLDAIAIDLARAEALVHNNPATAESMLRSVEHNPAAQISMRLEAEHALAKLYDSPSDIARADATFKTALTTFESARAQLKNEDSKLPFVANATDIYDDYIHFLVAHGRTDEALSVADQSRGRTLEQGLGLIGDQASFKPAALHPTAIARQQSSTLLFYWLGEKQSYLWAITPRKTALFTLPPQRQIAAVVERYRNTLLGPTDPLASADPDGQALYNMLVAPAQDQLRANQSVIVLTDGVLSQLNFETLIAPSPTPHYWIEDANIVSAQSLYILASARKPTAAPNKLLLLGNARSVDPDFPELASAQTEMQQISRHFPAVGARILNRASATPASYLASSPQDYSFIHFVAHGAASRTDPLDSAIILSPGAAPENAYKLYARDIIQHPIKARLVTISACSGSGSRSYSGEGLVGLSWAFLRAGAHNVIAALWEVSDNSTPDLMNDLYDGMQRGLSPSAALRNAKLAFVHSKGRLRKPFYWAPFQVYTGL